ncbi:MAG: aminotransferase class V-fold PLP-dependent enzyme [Chromatiales bacterium]|jgi:selenocysteine lyase/cysteine desulfurase
MPTFDLDPELIYLNHAAVAPWPVCTAAAVTRFAEENRQLGATHYPSWLEVERQLRAQLAELINIPCADDIALLKSTSEGLSTIAYGIDWHPGDNIVSIAQEFPSNRIVWESLRSQGVALRLLDLDGSEHPEQDLIGLCDERTRLVSVSSVQYASGLRLELSRIGTHCRDRQILFCVDAIQSLGALPFDVQSNLADFVVADAHKWLLGPEGTALFYCRAEIRERLRLHQYGWHMVEQAGDFERQDWTPAHTARRFECGSPNVLGIHALQASLSLILEQGVDRIGQRILANGRCIINEVEGRGFELISPREERRRAGILTFRVPQRDNRTLQRELMNQQVICAYRGGGIRFSPHFHNTASQIRQAFTRLDKII